MSTVRKEDRDGGVRILTLDRPPANAITEELCRDLLAALDDAAASDPVRAVVLRGAGRFFSGGFDLTAPRRDPAAVDEIQRLYRDSHLRLLELPKPTIAWLGGHATAGGLVLVLACDYRLGAVGEYKIGLNEIAIGASFPRIAFEIVNLRLPHARAAELLLGANLYPASEAQRLGIVDEVFPAEQIEEKVLRRAARLGSFPREAYAHTKAALIAAAVARVRSETPEEAARTAAVWLMDESRAARKAQRAKLGMNLGMKPGGRGALA